MAIMNIDKPLSLADIEPGTSGLIKDMDLPKETSTRLAGLGICKGRNIHVVKRGEPVIVRTYGSRVGLAASLANQILMDVTP